MRRSSAGSLPLAWFPWGVAALEELPEATVPQTVGDSMPNTGVQLTAESVRCAPAAGSG
jgi:hypothetical protein